MANPPGLALDPGTRAHVCVPALRSAGEGAAARESGMVRAFRPFAYCPMDPRALPKAGMKRAFGAHAPADFRYPL